jgi:hypothetical protein
MLAEVRAALRSDHEPTTLESLSFQCRARDTLRARTAYCTEILAAPHVADVEQISLPHPLRWAYYFVRPARLVAKRLRRVRAQGSSLKP